MIPTLSLVCSLPTEFSQNIEDYAAGHCQHVELWLTKLEAYLERHSLDDAVRLLADQQMQAPVASFQGGLLTSQGEARKQHWEHFARRLVWCQALGVQTLVVAGDLLGPLDEQDLQRVLLSLRQAAEEAARHGMRIALEFQAKASFGNNLQTALALVEQVNHPALGICLDAFHFAVGPSKTEDLLGLTSQNLFHVQLCDLLGTPRELATDSDRILPGEGDLPLSAILERLRDIDYSGCVSIETYNPQLWQVSARQFGEVAMTALRRCLGQASMAG